MMMMMMMMMIACTNVSQTVIHSGLQAVSEDKLYQTLNESIPKYVCTWLILKRQQAN
jgi:hypothetical protein